MYKPLVKQNHLVYNKYKIKTRRNDNVEKERA